MLANHEEKYLNLMLDLETLGTEAGCGILSIGAVVFHLTEPQIQDMLAGRFYNGFYIKVAPMSNKEYGLYTHPGTMDWWDKQTPEVRSEAFSGTLHLKEALQYYVEHIKMMQGAGYTVLLWGNGSDFDNTVIAHALSVCQLENPIQFRDHRCFRTLKNLFKHVIPAPKFKGERHHAYSDATFQAHHAEAIMDWIDLKLGEHKCI